MLSERKLLFSQIEMMKDMEPPLQVEAPEHLEGQLNSIESELNKLYQSNNMLRFRYNDPYINFPRSSIKGKLFMLFKVKDKKH
jgi:hypothetical protein